MTAKEKLEALLRKSEDVRSVLDDASSAIAEAKEEAEQAKSSADEAAGAASDAESHASSANSAADTAIAGLGEVSERLEQLDAAIMEIISDAGGGENQQESLLTDEEKDDFIVTLGDKMRSRFQQSIADVLDDTIEEAVNSTLKEVKSIRERRASERGGN